jgi:hypothetical protein
VRGSDTNLYGLARNNHTLRLVVGSEEGRSVDIGRDSVTPVAHDIIFRVIFDYEVKEILLVNACLFEDCAPMSPLFIGGTSDVVLDKSL